MYDYSNYDFYVLKSERMRNASYGFTTYTDIATGEVKGIYDGKKDSQGNPMPRHFNFSPKHRKMRIPKKQKDVNGTLVSEFIKNHPDCEGSPNNRTGRFAFKLLDDEKDAKVALEQTRLRLEAENIAANLKGQDLFDVGAVFGTFDKREEVVLHALADAAHQNPQNFLEVVNSPDMKGRALINKALTNNLFTQKGKMIVWENETIGVDMDEAISRVLKDTKLNKAIATALDKMGA